MATYDLTSSIPAASSLAAGDILNCPYSGEKKEIILPKGKYKLEVWGAQGGYRSSSTYGGKGGYSYGTINLPAPTTVYLYAGGFPGSTSSSAGSGTTRAGGFNGGGARYGYYGGGGGSDIRIGTDSLYARVIVAGGGGSDGSVNRQGMYGGGTSGGSTSESYGSGGGGGTQTAGGTGGSSNAGTFGQGGVGLYRSSGYAGAGGGGWYGGGGSYPDGSGDDDRGGGGGSGYILTSSSSKPSGYLLDSEYYLTDAAMVAGNSSFKDYSGSTATGHSGHGACRITVIEAIQLKNEYGPKNLYIKTGEKGSLPSGYIELPYIESRGAQYIDTNVYPNQNTRVICKISGAPISNTGVIFGSRTSQTSSDRFGFLCSGEGFYRTDFYNSNGNYDTSVNYKDFLVIDKNKFTTTLNNEKIIANPNGNFTGSYPLYLFAYNTAGTITASSSIKMYNCKIYDNEVLVRNFIPALRTSDKKAGLYDIVNNVFYIDNAGGNFLYDLINEEDSDTLVMFHGDSLLDQSGNNYTITNNGVTLSKTGKFDRGSLYFNGSSSLSFPLSHSGDLTLEGWFYQTSSTNSSYPTPYTLGLGSYRGLYLHALATTTFCATSTSNAQLSGTGQTTKLNEWIHFAQVLSGTTCYNFINGELKSTITGVGTNYTRLVLGTLSESDSSLSLTSCNWQGYLSEFKITKRAKWLSDFIPPTRPYETFYSLATNLYLKTPTNTIFNDGYFPLDYIESNGTQWIQTNFTPNQDTSIYVDVQCSGAHSGHAALCSARPTSSTSTNTIMIFLLSGTAWNVDRGSTSSNRTAFPTVSLTDRITIDLNKHHMSFNKGEVVHNFSSIDTFTCGGPLALLYDYSHSQYPMNARIYSCKVWDNGTLVRDFIPVLRLSDSMAGLYDKVNSIFYPDAAGGNFIYNINTINNNDIYYIKGDNATTNLGSSGTITNSNVITTGNELYFNGSSSKLILSESVTTGTNDWTIDYWEYRLNVTDDSCAYHQLATTSGAHGLLLGYCNSGSNTTQQFYASSDGASWTISGVSSGNKILNEWVHRAFVRKGNVLYAFENGKLYTTISLTFSIPQASSPTLGIYAYQNGTVFYSNMYIKQFRASNISRWTQNFEPPKLTADNLWKSAESIYLKSTSPSGYTRLEYLESTGTQYTDTGLIPNQDTKIVIDCILPTTSSGSYYICGARESSYVGNYSLQTTSGVYYSKHGTADVSLSIASINHRMKMIKNGNVFSVNGTLGYNTPVDFTSPNSMYLFACNSAGSVYGLTPCIIYRVQIYQDGETLSRDMVPMLRNNDGKTGFYDLVNNTFYPNLDTTAEFNYIINNGWEKIF